MSEDRIKSENEMRLNEQKKQEQDDKENQVRQPMDMRFRGKLSEFIYGSPPIQQKSEEPVTPP